jgi:hypothetical protein
MKSRGKREESFGWKVEWKGSKVKAAVLDRDRNGAVWAFREWWKRRSIDGDERTNSPGQSLEGSKTGHKLKRMKLSIPFS